MKKIYIVDLTEEEREYLKNLGKKGKISARKLIRSKILLLSDAGKIDREIKEALGVSAKQIELARMKFIEGGVEYALNDVKRKGGERKLDAKGEAFLVALACSDPPEGRKRWTIEMLADKLVELNIVDSIGDETVRLLLKKKN